MASVTASDLLTGRPRADPPPRHDLCRAGQRLGQEFGLLTGEPGVASDGVGDGRRDRGVDPVGAGAHGGLVRQVGLEDQPEDAGVAAVLSVDEVEVPSEHIVHPQLVVIGHREAGTDRVDQRVGMRIEDGEIEVELARKCWYSTGFETRAQRCRPLPRRGTVRTNTSCAAASSGRRLAGFGSRAVRGS
jgi:hypothetical protein